MSLLHSMACRGRLSDRLIRRAARRVVLRHADRIEAAAASAPEARGAAGPLWRPGELGWPPSEDRLRDLVLGGRRLATAAHWPAWARDLDAAEDEMLRLVAERAAITPRHRTLVLARERDALAAYLIAEMGVAPVVWTMAADDALRLRRDASRRGIGDLEVRHGPLAEAFEENAFDRILALESLPGAAASLRLLAPHLRPGGRLFLQLACHRRYTWQLSPGEARWLQMEPAMLVPATDLAPRLASPLELAHHWELSGEHYERTLRAWRRRLDRDRAEVLRLVAKRLDERGARRALGAWRTALLAREAMFGARGGQEWWISQYALERPGG